MADPTPVNSAEEQYPPRNVWAKLGPHYRSELILNWELMSYHWQEVILANRIKLYINSVMVNEQTLPELKPGQTQRVCLNDIWQAQTVGDYYVEIITYPTNQSATEMPYFGEIWCYVASDDGRVLVSYPPNLIKGDNPSLVDNRYMYYPGVNVDGVRSARLVLLNGYWFDHLVTITIFDASGKRSLVCRKALTPKSVINASLRELFPQEDLQAFFADGPGLVLLYSDFKINSYVQLHDEKTGVCYGMDHLGILFDGSPATGGRDDDEVKIKRALTRRGQDKLICYCRGMSESEVVSLYESGASLATIMKDSGVGTVCTGCRPELEKLCRLRG